MPKPFFPAVGIFADRETVGEAEEYVADVSKHVTKGDGPLVITAAYVLYNTTAKLANAEIAKRDALLREAADKLQGIQKAFTGRDHPLAVEIYAMLGEPDHV